VAGPQLIIGDESAVRCLNLRSEMVTTIAGSDVTGGADGPASRARFLSVIDIVVAPNGVLFVADRLNECVRRISTAKWPASDATAALTPAPERVVTTLIGEAGPDVQFAPSAAASFRKPIGIDGLALHTPPLPVPYRRPRPGLRMLTLIAMWDVCTSLMRRD
jgi:hypothetical protein